MQRERRPVVSILASKRNGTLYTGVTSNLLQRLHQHREALINGFSKEHGTTRLMWYEVHETMPSAIVREKRIKAWKRQWRINLIEATNPYWRDLAVELGFPALPALPVRRILMAGDGFLPSQE